MHPYPQKFNKQLSDQSRKIKEHEITPYRHGLVHLSQPEKHIIRCLILLQERRSKRVASMQGKVSILLESGSRRVYVTFAEDLRKMMLAIKLPMIAIKLAKNRF